MCADGTIFQRYARLVPDLLVAVEEKQCPYLEVENPWLADRSSESRALEEGSSGQVQHGHEHCPL